MRTWDSDGELMGLPNGEIWDLEKGWGGRIPALPYHQATGTDPAEYQGKAICWSNGCTCLWHSFLEDATGGDYDMQEGLQISIGASLYAVIVTIG